MQKFFSGLKKVEETLTAIFLVAMVLDVFIATVGRYTALFSLPWAEELSRFLMIWLVFVGAGAVAGEGGHYGVDIVVTNLPRLGQKICLILTDIFISAFCIFVAWYGMQNVISQFQKAQQSPAMHVPIWIMYLSVIIGCVLVLLQYVYHSVITIRKMNQEEKGELAP